MEFANGYSGSIIGNYILNQNQRRFAIPYWLEPRTLQCTNVAHRWVRTKAREYDSWPAHGKLPDYWFTFLSWRLVFELIKSSNSQRCVFSKAFLKRCVFPKGVFFKRCAFERCVTIKRCALQHIFRVFYVFLMKGVFTEHAFPQHIFCIQYVC